MDTRRAISLLIAALLAISSAVARAAPQPSVVRLGVLTDLSGTNSALGNQTRAGLEVAKVELASRGKTFEYILEDSKSDPAKALGGLQKLVSIDKVDALYVDLSPVAFAVSPEAQRHQIPLLYLGGATSILSRNPYALKSSLDFQEACSVLGRYFRHQGIQKPGVVQVDVEASEICDDGLRTVYPEVMIKSLSSVSDDPRAVLLAMKASGIDAVMNQAFEVGLLNLLKAGAEYDFNVPFATYSFNVSSKVVSSQPQAISRVVSIGFPAVSSEFKAAWEKIAGGLSDAGIEFAALAYLHSRQLADAIQSCPPRDVACQIEKVGRANPEQLLGFRGFKDRKAQFDVVVRRWHEGHFVEALWQP